MHQTPRHSVFPNAARLPPSARCSRLPPAVPAYRTLPPSPTLPPMLLMDRENLMVPGWSHVLSSTNDLAELEALRQRVGAPPRALHRKDPARPHLDLKLVSRALALVDAEVRVFDSTKELLRCWHGFQRATIANRS